MAVSQLVADLQRAVDTDRLAVSVLGSIIAALLIAWVIDRE